MKVKKIIILILFLLLIRIESSCQIILKRDNVEYICFTNKQIQILIKDLKDKQYNDTIIDRLNDKIIVLDSLNIIYENIIIIKDKEIYILNKEIILLKDNNFFITNNYEEKIKRKNSTILKLSILSISSILLLILLK